MKRDPINPLILSVAVERCDLVVGPSKRRRKWDWYSDYKVPVVDPEGQDHNLMMALGAVPPAKKAVVLELRGRPFDTSWGIAMELDAYFGDGQNVSQDASWCDLHGWLHLLMRIYPPTLYDSLGQTAKMLFAQVEGELQIGRDNARVIYYLRRGW